jgi:hypothetical protein
VSFIVSSVVVIGAIMSILQTTIVQARAGNGWLQSCTARFTRAHARENASGKRRRLRYGIGRPGGTM